MKIPDNARNALIALLGFCLVQAAVAAPVMLEYRAVNADNDSGRTSFSIRISGPNLHISGSGFSDRDSALIYRAGTGEFVFIDHEVDEYTVMSEQWLTEARQKVEAHADRVKQKMDEAQKTMSVAQRQQYQQMQSMMKFMPVMGGLMGANQSEQPNYSASLLTSEFSGYRCKQLDERIKGDKTRIFCMASATDIGVSGVEATTFEKFVKTGARLKNRGVFEFGFSEPPLMIASEQVSGIPVAISWPDGSGYIVQPAKVVDDGRELF